MTESKLTRPSLPLSLIVPAVLTAWFATPACAQTPSSELSEPHEPVSAATETAPLGRPGLVPPPTWRLDFGVPAVGMGVFHAPAQSYDKGIMSATTDVRLVGISGHGAMVRYAFGTNIWGHGHGIEIDYVYRTRLSGDDRGGVGLDLMAGTSFGDVEHDENDVAQGAMIGANTAVQLDFRHYAFVVSFGAQYRGLVPLSSASGGDPVHVLTGTIGLGFGFND